MQNLQMYKCQITLKREWKNYKKGFQKLLKQNVKITKSFYDLTIVQWVKPKSQVMRGSKTLGIRNGVMSHGKEHVGFCIIVVIRQELMLHQNHFHFHAPLQLEVT
jgi:hypothetical protein